MLLNAAEKATVNSYSPYYDIHIGVAALHQSGKVITGANMGNASTSVNICAERAVLLTANNLGFREILKLAIFSKEADAPLTPCGICRQFLLEVNKITGRDLIVLSSNFDKSSIIKTSINELLPYPYSRQ